MQTGSLESTGREHAENTTGRVFLLRGGAVGIPGHGSNRVPAGDLHVAGISRRHWLSALARSAVGVSARGMLVHSGGVGEVLPATGAKYHGDSCIRAGFTEAS